MSPTRSTVTTALVISGSAASYAFGISAFTRATGGLDAAERKMTVATVGVLAIVTILGSLLHPPLVAQFAVTTAVLLAVVGASVWHAQAPPQPEPATPTRNTEAGMRQIRAAIASARDRALTDSTESPRDHRRHDPRPGLHTGPGVQEPRW